MRDFNNSIIIARKEYFPLLFRFKNQNNNLNIKIISDNDLYNLLSFRYKNNPIAYLIKNYKYNYNQAKYILNILRKADFKDNKPLELIYNELFEHDYLEYDLYGKYELSLNKIYLFEIKDNLEIRNLINKANLQFEDLSIEEIIKPNEINKEVYYLDNKYEQYFYIFNSIKNELLKDMSKAESIKILIKDEADLFYINLCANIFDIPCFYTETKQLVENKEIAAKIKDIYAKKDFAFTAKELADENLKVLSKYIEDYKLTELDFDFAYANLIEILNDVKVKETVSNKGIKIINNYIIDPDAIIYITNFDYNSFYSHYIDNALYNDSELENLHLNTSYQKTKIDKRLKENYLRYANIALLSRVKRHLNEKIHDSDFIKQYGIKIVEPQDSIFDKFNLKTLNLYNQNILDENHIYKNKKLSDDLNYNYYDNKFTGIKTDYFKKNKWSVTDIEKYIDCPFKYYLSKFIKLTDDEGYNQARGTLIHSVFEQIYHPDYDYEEAFNNAILEYKANKKSNNKQYTIKDDIYIEIIRYWLKYFVDVHKEQAFMIDVPKDFRDYEVTIPYKVLNYDFNGRIDKVILTNKKYCLIDYKSGVETFNPQVLFLAKSIQLPLYYYASEKDDLFKRDFGGLFICHNYTSKFSSFANTNKDREKYVFSKEALISFMRFDGLYLNDEAFIKSIDPFKNLLKDSSPNFDSEGNITFGGRNALKDKKYNLDMMVKDSIEAVKNTISSIENNQFPIKPTSMNLKTVTDQSVACNFCDYKSICYAKKKDFVEYKDKIEKHFH